MTSNIITSRPVAERPPYYSVSALRVYRRCGMEFYHKYVDLNRKSGATRSTLLGNLVHEALELYYDPEVEHDYNLEQCLEETYISALMAAGVIVSNTPASDQTTISSYLMGLVDGYAVLHNRARADYKGPDAIRTTAGKVSSAYQSTTAWKQAEEPLLALRHAANEYMLMLNPELDTELDVIGALTDAFNLCRAFIPPKEFKRTIYVELPISEYNDGTIINEVPMPTDCGGDAGINLLGFIDWVGITSHGLTIVDYKTSKSAYTTDKLAYNPQLCAYAYAYEKLTGTRVDAMGIYNVREGSLVLTPIDRSIMDRVLTSFFGTHKLITAGFYPHHYPEDNYSPCLDSFGKPCPYLHDCYPELAEEQSLLDLYRLLN